MSTNRKYVIWMVGVAIFALTIGSLIPSRPIERSASPSASLKSVASPRGSKGSGTTAAAPQSPSVPASASSQKSATPARPPVAASGRFAPPPKKEEIEYSALHKLMSSKDHNITSLTFDNGSDTVVVSQQGKPDAVVVIPDEGGQQELRALAFERGIPFVVKAVQEPGPNLLWIGCTIAAFLLMLFIGASVMNARNGGGGMLGILRSPGKRVDELGNKVPKVKFTDVAGCDEAVKELKRVVNGLIGKEIYSDFDAELPTGVLLVGPPGTGKTLLAKAAAGEVDGTMDVMSGSDFVMMFVGVGAGRIRDTFERARKNVEATGKPHIIFIDEIDAVGGKRGGGAASSGSNQEREQTLNQLLVEMDGVVGHKGILLMAATNRADMLDEALLRPGRFECQVQVDLPDRSGREALFAIYCRRKPRATEATLQMLASRSYGYSGAEIKGACNRAAIVAAERWATQTQHLRTSGVPLEKILTQFPREIALKDFDEGIDFVRHGNAEPGKQANMSAKQKENTAGHEAGHAIASAVMGDSDPVVKITILRRRGALGYVQQMPDGDRVSLTSKEAIARIVMAMSGRAAQVVLFGVSDSGAGNDLEQANNLARMMVTRWGMSRLGHIFVGEAGPSPMRGMGGNGVSCGPALADAIDTEVRRIVETCFGIAMTIARTDEERLKKLTAILMQEETILADGWKRFIQANPTKVKPEDVAFDPTAPAEKEVQ